MQQAYIQSARVALAGHVTMIVAAIAFSFLQSVLRRPRELPIEFSVVLDPGRVAPAPDNKPLPPSREIEPIRDPDPPPPVPPVPDVIPDKPVVIDKKPDPKPPDPKPPRPEIKIGPRILRPTNATTKPARNRQPLLSAAEIERLLKQGVPPGERNTIPEDEISRCMLLIKRALYAAWAPPSRAEAGNRPAELELRFGAGGRIIGSRLTLPSGNAAYDRSVLVAADAVDRVDGLTAAFLQRYDRLTVAFVLDDVQE